MSKIKVGFLGLGRIADLHQAGYVNNPDAELYAICDTNSETLQLRQQQWGVPKAYTSFAQMLLDPQLDAVEILTPTHLHAQNTIEALEAGKHVSVQKPMANTLEEADAMIAAAEKAGKLLKVSDNYSHYEPIVLAKRMIDEGKIGTPTNIRFKLISGGSGGWEVPMTAWGWRVQESQAGRGLQTFDHGYHFWTTAYWLFGEVDKVSAWIDYIDGFVDSPATIMWKYKEPFRYGVCDYCYETEMPMPYKYYACDEWFEISGSKGIILINRCSGQLKSGPAVQYFDGQWHDIHCEYDDWGEGFKGSTRNFAAAISGHEPANLTAEQGRYVLKFDLAIQKSNMLNREVYVDELDERDPESYFAKRHADEIENKRNRRIPLEELAQKFGLGEMLKK